MNIGIFTKPMRRAREEQSSAPSAVVEREATGIGLRVRQHLWHQMVRECEAMVQFALSMGYTVPIEVVHHEHRRKLLPCLR